MLRVGIVGCGGTGSAVGEQLARLGVRDFTLIDPDTLTPSNVSRVYGSRPQDVGKPKVSVTGTHLKSITAGEAAVREIQATLTTRSAAECLTDLDVIFGCTDDNAGRLVLSRASTYLLAPVVDCGVLLSSSTDGALQGIDGRVTTLVPGQACLVCRGRIDLARAATELLTPAERRRRVDEGYAPALAGVEPAVVTFTSSVASAAVAELLERLTAYGPPQRPSEVLLRFHDREVSTNSMEPRKGHYCDPTRGKIGLGRTAPFLQQTWAQ
jgi:molybdopterin/thiamine biosynthesis adenylyltransferase